MTKVIDALPMAAYLSGMSHDAGLADDHDSERTMLALAVHAGRVGWTPAAWAGKKGRKGRKPKDLDEMGIG